MARRSEVAARQYGFGGGERALRGHFNIQGLTGFRDCSTSLLGHLTLPSWKTGRSANLSGQRIPLKATLADQVNYWGNYPARQPDEIFRGDAAQKENDWGFARLPMDQSYDVIKYFNMMDSGKVTGYFCRFNPVASFRTKQSGGAKLKQTEVSLVVIDPLVTETSTFWQNRRI